MEEVQSSTTISKSTPLLKKSPENAPPTKNKAGDLSPSFKKRIHSRLTKGVRTRNHVRKSESTIGKTMSNDEFSEEDLDDTESKSGVTIHTEKSKNFNIVMPTRFTNTDSKELKKKKVVCDSETIGESSSV